MRCGYLILVCALGPGCSNQRPAAPLPVTAATITPSPRIPPHSASPRPHFADSPQQAVSGAAPELGFPMAPGAGGAL